MSDEHATDLQQPCIALFKFEAQEYRHLLEQTQMSEEEKDQFLYALWKIMSAFVDLGWGLDSVQLFQGIDQENSGADSSNPLPPETEAWLRDMDVFNKAAKQKGQQGGSV